MPVYDPLAYPAVGVTVDLVVLTVREARLWALLVRRGEEPFLGRWALPGGFVRPDESLAEAAARELREETGLRLATAPAAPAAPSAPAPGHLEQLGAYGDPGRDPRLRVVSIAWLALVPEAGAPVAGTDAALAAWAPVDDALAGGPDGALAFDHARVLADGVERARAKLEYTPLAAAFCPPEFTVAELREVYEAVWGTALDPRNFHRKVTGTPGFVIPLQRTTSRGGGRPAALFARGAAATLVPPLSRPAVEDRSTAEGATA